MVNNIELICKNIAGNCRLLALQQHMGSNSAIGHVVVRRCLSLISLLCLTFLSLVLSEEVISSSRASANQTKSTATDYVPAYHDRPPEGTLPAIIDPGEFDKPVVQHAYRLALTLTSTIYQQPCYCHCDRAIHHTSLFDCYATKHTNGCTICLRELFYVYEQSKKGWTPEQIREGLMKGDWKTVDPNKYGQSEPIRDQRAQ